MSHYRDTLGGASITNDLAVVLEVSTEVGERLARGRRPGACSMNAGRRLDEVEYDQDAEDDGDYIFMDFKLAREVVDARVKEIFTMIQTDLRRSGYDEMIAAGVVLTGGGSRLNGLTERVSEILGTPVRVGAPTGLTGRGQVVHSPEYAAAVGLTMWSSGPPSVPVREIQESPETRGVVVRAAGWFREFLLP
ncbi:MAG: cell division FtsA domain-containing protein [Chloroflexia bacterium]